MLKQENIFFKLVNLQECDFERQQCVKSYLYWHLELVGLAVHQSKLSIFDMPGSPNLYSMT